jgi:hypothetical protein
MGRPNFDPSERAARMRRHHACMLACATALFAGAAAIAINAWRQRGWLAYQWQDETGARLGVLACSALVAGAASLRLALAWKRGSWTSIDLRPVRWFFTVAVLAWIAVWRPEPTAPKQDLLAALALAAGLWSASVCFARLRDGDPRRRWARALDIGAFSLAACVLAGECALRGLRGVTHDPLLLTAGGDVDTWIREHRQAPGRHRFGFPINSAGFVDRELADAPRPAHLVACIGDSFSVAVVPHDRHYTSVAEREFEDLEVYNIGTVDAGPHEYRRMIELYARPLHPDLIVVGLFLGNDIVNAHRRRSNALSAWCDWNQMLVVQLPRRAWALSRERGEATMLADGGRDESAFSIPATLALSSEEVARQLPWLDDPLREPPAMSAERFAFVESTRALDVTRVAQSDYSDMIASLDELRAAAAPTPLAFLLIPDEFQVDDALWNEVERALGDAPHVRTLPQKVVRAELERRGLRFADLLPELRACEPLADGRAHVYHARDTHFNSRGNAVAGHALAELIERCGVAQRIARDLKDH